MLTKLLKTKFGAVSYHKPQIFNCRQFGSKTAFLSMEKPKGKVPIIYSDNYNVTAFGLEVRIVIVYLRILEISSF